ncbi:helix-turn-helix domain-containing protein [Thioflexithrix psekupsensis]|uniref:Winged helix-turn helix domain-containing protein n=1 Tax=Thioflexithrix psekupsensis TaxID=1570016 RepID=A0A251X596_9GAMM|nr:helix-turn-helix domain-containing protein [Thioflexithrix psekupsensis]OUD12550.1 hypothetical protein TPSD3_15810 [Thioflexithrix psekupsensis]
MANQYPELLELQETGDRREMKRALAVRMSLLGYSRPAVAEVCGCSVQFIDKWKAAYAKSGISGLKLAYKGSEGYLSDQQREHVLQWLNAFDTIAVRSLKEYLEKEWDVVYCSETSYVQLLEQAGFCYEKSQKLNPQRLWHKM